jgi:hypothetical protein
VVAISSVDCRDKQAAVSEGGQRLRKRVKRWRTQGEPDEWIT